MSISKVVEQIVIFGLLLWVVEAFVPMNRTTRRVLQAAVSVLLILWILQGLGLVHTNIQL